MAVKKAKKRILASCAVTAATAAAIAFCAAAFDMRMTSVEYQLQSDKISSLRIAFISDLHNSLYGKNQSELITAVDKAKPDIVVFGGDMADKTQDFSPDNSYIAAEYFGKNYRCYYSMGNHEYSRGDSDKIKEDLSAYGITVLEGSSETIEINGSEIEICGLFSPDLYIETPDGEFISQLDAVSAPQSDSRYRILIAHFPELIDEYLTGGFDLVLSGHAHGGQWRIPGILNGFFAPGQGFFPKYAGGRYTHGNTEHIVSRGLWKPSTLLAIPRIFNRPELVIVEIN